MTMEILPEPTSNKLCVTNRFALIVLSSLRRSDKENKQVRLVLTEPKVHVKMEMKIPRSSRVKFITACSYSIEKYKDMMKAQFGYEKANWAKSMGHNPMDGHNRKEDGDGIWHAEVRLTEPYENVDDQGFMNKPTKRKLSKYHKLSDVMSPNQSELMMTKPVRHDPNDPANTRSVLNKISCTEEIENMLEIKVYEAGSREDIFSSEAYRRVFYINELIYTELCHEFYSTYDFGGLRSDENFNDMDYSLSISSEEELHLSRSLALTIRTLDVFTLKELTSPNGRLIFEDPSPGVPHVAIPKGPRPYMYAGVFEHMAGVYDVALHGAYNPPGYDQQ
ncbi:hypothetical protein Tco_1002531 [Tanacetum coccineum]|uniref:Uncharacterized protein n=1 Tax=Tanacetum coccineum TaxID=301880 RepID=A0ABQ5F7Z6_9ASTR